MGFSFLLIVVGLLLVAFGSEWLVSGASSLARRLRVSELLIGLTIVSFGTSAPELVVNLFAVGGGNTGLAIGNLLGSNIFNILVILGVASLIYPITVKSSTVWIEIPLSLLAVIMACIFANDVLVEQAAFSVVSRSDGLALLGFFMVFMYYTYFMSRRNRESGQEEESQEKGSLLKMSVLVLIGLVGLAAGGRIIVIGAVDVATGFGVSQNVIGLTIVAAGTSVPELAAAVAASLRKKPDLVVGNVVGSNIFNIFFIMGIGSTIRPLPIAPSVNQDLLITTVASLLLFFFSYTGKRTVKRWEGGILVALYCAYIVFLLWQLR